MEIIPKKVSELPKWFNILFYSSLGVLVLAIIIFFVLNTSLKNSKSDLEGQKEALAAMNTSEMMELERNILSVERKVKDYSFLLGQHLESSEAFGIIQKNCHPKVYFSQLSLTSRDGKVSVSGSAKSFEVLGQQALLLKESPDIENIDLSQVAINKDGGVNFNLVFTFKEGVLKY